MSCGNYDVFDQLPSVEDAITPEQLSHFANSLGRMDRRLENSAGAGKTPQTNNRPINWLEWHSFIEAAGAYGFVCRDTLPRAASSLSELAGIPKSAIW